MLYNLFLFANLVCVMWWSVSLFIFISAILDIKILSSFLLGKDLSNYRRKYYSDELARSKKLVNSSLNSLIVTSLILIVVWIPPFI
jgi:hypothetical protein